MNICTFNAYAFNIKNKINIKHKILFTKIKYKILFTKIK